MSLRAELVRLGTRLLIKRRSRPDLTIEQKRQHLASAKRFIPAPPAGTVTLTVDAGGVMADLLTTQGSLADRRILYLHGGGFVLGSPSHYRHILWRMASTARASMVSVDYRLAPEYPFPAALDNAVTAYEWLLDDGADPNRVAIIGDSAGGGLVFSLLLRVRDRGLPMPAAAVALSPWTDLALTGASIEQNADADPFLITEELIQMANEYLAGADPTNPYASPLYGDLAGLPPTLIQVGSDEILRDDATRMAHRMRVAGCQVQLEIWPRMLHVWHLFAPLLPEANQAIEHIGAFVRTHAGGDDAAWEFPQPVSATSPDTLRQAAMRPGSG